MVERMMSIQQKTKLEEPYISQIIAAAKKDPRAFGELFLLYAQPVFRYLYSRIGSYPDAEDATAQTFLAALERFPQYRHNGYFASWLFTIARNKAMDHFRRQRREASLDEAECAAADDNMIQQVIQAEGTAALSRFICALPEDEQELIRLRYVAELSYSEIGYLLGQKEDTVKKTLYRLLARLKVQLENSHV